MAQHSSTSVTPVRPVRSRRLILPLILLALGWLFCLSGLLVALYLSPQISGDFKYYFRGAQRFLNELPLYQGIDPGGDYVGPPLIIQMVLPLITSLSYPAAVAGWYLVNVGAFLASMVMIMRVLTSRRVKVILWTASLFAMPLWFSLWLGQINTIILLLIVGAWYAYRKQQPVLTGVLLAIAVWTKFYPGLLILYFLWKRDWRVVGGAVIGTIGILLFQTALVGFTDFARFFTEVLPPLMSQGQPGLNHSNNSVLGFAQRLFGESPQVINLVNSPLLLSLTRYSFTTLLLGGLLYYSARPRIKLEQTPLAKFDLEYALTLIVALLLGSTLGIHGMLLTVLPFALVLEYMPSGSRVRFMIWMLLAFSLINVHLFIIIGYLQPPSDNVMPALTLSLPFFGMMILWIATLILLRNYSRRSG